MDVKYQILKAMADERNQISFNTIKSFMNSGQKINAIKEIRLLGKTTPSKLPFGLKESKDFINCYYEGVGSNVKPNISELQRDVGYLSKSNAKNTSKSKRLPRNFNTKRGVASQYTISNMDIRQVDNDTLMKHLKAIKKELKKRGKKL